MNKPINLIKQTCLLIAGICFLTVSVPGKADAVLPGDLNADGTVSISEVQKVINSFLGLIPDSPLVTAGKVVFGSPSSFTVTGTDLDKNVATPTGACTSLTEQPGGTATLRSYSCVPSAVGALDISISSASTGTVLSQTRFVVPNPQVTMVTTMGTIVIELNPTKAPKTVNNFLQYVREGFYDNTIIHRVVKGFVVQGGGYGTNLTQKATHAAIELEPPSVTGLTNSQGTIAMARAQEINTATSQFYFNTVNNSPGLDLPAGQGYAVFGSILQGMPVVQAIDIVPVDSTYNLPVTMITVTSVRQTR